VRRLSADSTSRAFLMPVMLAVVDAGVLYSATLLVMLLFFTQRNNGQYVVLDSAWHVLPRLALR
jgi:hypothetical protein